MRKLSAADAERLGTFLLSLDEDAMLLSTLDGFLAGIVICPETIMPSEWLPQVWGADGPVFEDASEAHDVIGLIMARYNEIVHGLQRRGRFIPILELDTDEAYLWEFWAEGFAQAIGLRMNNCWDQFESAEDEDVRAAMGFLSMLATHALTTERLDDPLDRQLRTDGHRFIASCLETLNAARMANHQAKTTPAPTSVGRNDPCPCGSGRKFKKCCLQ